MPKAPKKPVSEKKRIASQKNIDAWEAKQAEANRISNDKEVFAKGVEAGIALAKKDNLFSGIVIGGSVVFIADLLVRALSV